MPTHSVDDHNTEFMQFMKDEYPDSKSDLFAGFIERCTSLAGPRGTVAMITMQSWMFLSSYEKLRASLLANQRITSMLHLGARAFDSIGGEVVSATAFVLANVPSEARSSARKRPGTFIRLVDGTSEADKVAALSVALEVRTKDAGFYLASDADFAAIPGTPIVYWLSEKMRATFATGRPLREVAEPRKGMDTGDNARFLRAWWEISRAHSSLTKFQTGSWVPYNKGGGFRRWYGYREFLLDWRNGGKDMRTRSGARYFGQEGWTWGTVTSGGLSMRYTPPGAAFDNGGCTLFADTDLSAAALILNSSTADAILAAISPTLNFQPINIGAVPLAPGDALAARAKPAVEALVAHARADWDNFETSWDFARNPLVECFEQN
jgi:hypothetical protein